MDCLSQHGRPIFILTSPRSGSTLLRFILDTHPRIASPAETNIGVLLANLRDAVYSLNGTLTRGGLSLSELAHVLMRDTFDKVTEALGKARWCDKSLTSLEHADLLVQLFPDAQFLLLHRSCLDFIVSAIEACPWGYTAFGFEPYIRRSPDNFVQALAIFWLDQIEAMLHFEQRYSHVCHRVSYEQLTMNTTVILRKMYDFLGEAWDETEFTPETPFLSRHGDGPGDLKIAVTDRIHDKSVGKGERIPQYLVTCDIRERINSASLQLGYSAPFDQCGRCYPCREYVVPPQAVHVHPPPLYRWKETL